MKAEFAIRRATWVAEQQGFTSAPAVAIHTISGEEYMQRVAILVDGWNLLKAADRLKQRASLAELAHAASAHGPDRYIASSIFTSAPTAAPEDLLYAVVVKRRENGRVEEISTHIVYGTPKQIAAAFEASPVSAAISTYGVERNNLTIRQHSRRVGRRVHAFSKERDYLDYQLTLSFAYYHFVIPHRELRQRLEYPAPRNGLKGSPKKWRERNRQWQPS